MRRRLVLILIGVGLLVLAIELFIALPRLAEWHPWDYGNYLRMGRDVRAGNNPYGSDRYYPLPTMLWIFVPLSLLPEWFRVVWVIAPFGFILLLFRRQAIPLFAFVPLWFVVGDGMLDGWLLLPLVWLVQNRQVWAGLGAALMLFKPQLAILAVMYALAYWFATRDWKNLGVFALAMTIFYVPAFIINPNWIAQMLVVIPDRAAQTTMLLPKMTSSVWAWKELGAWGWLIVIVTLMMTLAWGWRAWRATEQRAAICQLLNLILNPILFASYLVMALPTLHGQKSIVIVTGLSWLAFGLDKLIGNFGGGYALIPLAALYFLSRENVGQI
jgi:hypothetical protein